MTIEKNYRKDNQKEQDLVVRLINGDEDAFCELYSSYKDRLIYYAISFLKSETYAEDVYQDTFTAIWQGRKFIDPNTSFSAYLYTIIKNRVLNQLREIEVHQKLKDNILSNAIDNEDHSHQTIYENDMKTIINKSLSVLTPRQREIFELSRQQLMSHKEIAVLLGVSVNTVQDHISSSLKMIREYLKKHYSEIISDSLIMLICLNI